MAFREPNDKPKDSETVSMSADPYYAERPEVAGFVPASVKSVIDLGCGPGLIGRGLKRSRPEVEVRGIETNSAEVTQAEDFLDAVHSATFEAGLPPGWPRPDCLILADVLEHLPDPWTTLGQWSDILLPGGYVVASVPNVAHRSVWSQLLKGRWDYQDSGIMDRTHFRFFTRNTAIELLEESGLRLLKWQRIYDAAQMNSIWRELLAVQKKREAKEIGSGLRNPAGSGVLARAADFQTAQFLFLAQK